MLKSKYRKAGFYLFVFSCTYKKRKWWREQFIVYYVSNDKGYNKKSIENFKYNLKHRSLVNEAENKTSL